LRFFERSDYRMIGQTLGSNEDAAQKRVTRALEKLHSHLKRQGVVIPAVALGSALAGEAVSAAPAGLATTLSVTALSAAGAGTTLTLIQSMTAAKLKLGIAGAFAVASIITPFVMQHQANARLRDQDQLLQQQADQIAGMQAANARLSNTPSQASDTREQLEELQRLRAEGDSLRHNEVEIARLKEEHRKLKTALPMRDSAADKTDLQIREEAVIRMNGTKNWLLAFYMYANDHGNTFPTNFSAAASFLSSGQRAQWEALTNQFEILFQGQVSQLEKPGEVIVLRERESWRPSKDSDRNWARIYGYADGHVEVRHAIDNDFEAYEKDHLIPPPADR
jgi:TolA-binding protein